LSSHEESLMVRKLNNFDDWIDYFRYWQDSIGLPQGALREFQFEAKFGDPEVPHIEFGHYKGQRKWPTVMHIPDQRIRDALLNLIVYQGDTEFASVEQQRNLLHHAPSDYDLLSLQRVMTRRCATAGRCPTCCARTLAMKASARPPSCSSAAPTRASGCSAPSTRSSTTGWTSSPTPSSSTATASSSSRCCRCRRSIRCRARWAQC